MNERYVRVYLAGGMRDGWQDKVINHFVIRQPKRPVLFSDPRTHGLTDEREYTRWDLAAIAASDIVFAYMTPDNPSGYGMSLEMGYAHALEKTIIFTHHQSYLDDRKRHFGMCRGVATYQAFGMKEALDILRNVIDDRA